QAEDGIRDGHVTGVQTCALPIYPTKVIMPPIANIIGMVPKISASIPANSTGKSERPAIVTPRTEKTLPLSSLGEFSPRTVCEGKIGRASCRESVEVAVWK